MAWQEFLILLSGLNHNTPLGQIVAIRAEDDPEILKTYSPAQKRIRSEYRNRKAKRMPKEQVENAIEQFKQAFIQMGK